MGKAAKAMKAKQGMAEGISQGRSEGISQGEAIGLSKGILQGKSEGMAEEKRRMVKSLGAQSVPLEVIAKASSLSIDEISRILDN